MRNTAINNNAFIIYGCGGHARSVADVCLFNDIEDLLFVDEQVREQEKLFGFDVVNLLPKHSLPCIVAIGDNHKRAQLFTTLKNSHHLLSTVIAHDAYVSRHANLALGVFVGHAVHIGPNVSIDENTIINTRSIIEHDCKIGKHSHVSVNSVVAGRSQLGEFVMIGTGAVVINNVKICSHVTIGAGAVVIDDITEPGTYVGVPARKNSLISPHTK
jgi:UDP-N-acetylbacillosamine N-acetyltransferase